MFSKWQEKFYLVMIFIKDSCRLEYDAASLVADVSNERSTLIFKSQELNSYLEDKSSGLIETLGDVYPRMQGHIRKDWFPQSYCRENIRTPKIFIISPLYLIH
jgi:hypothetical protein